MTDLTIVYWRDIPAQVISGRGRRAAKVPLSERFEKAIDMAAMRAGAKDADAYLAEWRKAPYDGAPLDAAQLAARLEEDYPQARLKTLIAQDGHATPNEPETP